MEMIINFTEQEMINIIKEKLEREGYQVESGKIVLESQWVGFGPIGRNETFVKGIEIKVSKENEIQEKDKKENKIEKRYQQNDMRTYFDR
jgi:hypothetical protein